MKISENLKIILISALVSFCSILIYDKFFAQKIVTFDLRGYIALLRDLYMAKQIDDAELKKKIDEIELIVNKTSKNKIIITSDVILGGDRVENLTPKISVSNTKKSGIHENESK